MRIDWVRYSSAVKNYASSLTGLSVGEPVGKSVFRKYEIMRFQGSNYARQLTGVSVGESVGVCCE